MKVTCPYCHKEIEKYHDESWNNHGCEARRSPAMTNEKEIENLAQIFANKRHSSIEWGRECARIVIEAGYRPASDKPEAGELEKLDKAEVTSVLSRVYCEPEHSKKELDVNLILSMTRAICQHFGQPPAVAIKWPDKEQHTCNSTGPCDCGANGWNACIDEMRRRHEHQYVDR